MTWGLEEPLKFFWQLFTLPWDSLCRESSLLCPMSTHPPPWFPELVTFGTDISEGTFLFSFRHACGPLSLRATMFIVPSGGSELE